MCIFCRLIILFGFLSLLYTLSVIYKPKEKTFMDIHYECTLRRGTWSHEKNVCVYFSPPKTE